MRPKSEESGVRGCSRRTGRPPRRAPRVPAYRGGRRPPGAALALYLGVSGAFAFSLAGPAALVAQAAGPPLSIGGLLRTGARLEPEDSERRDGFEVFDARLSVGGEVGIIFDYFLQGVFEDGGEERGLTFRLLDARLVLPIRPEAKLSFGQFKAPFGHERLLSKGDIRFLERSAATQALTPNRQVGLELSGETMEGRLAYRAGAFNGNGRNLRNDNDSFLFAGRIQFNNVGPIEFYEDLVVQLGANLAFSRDSAAPLGAGLDGRLSSAPGLPAGVDFDAFRGDRFLFGFDFHTSYRGWQVNGEVLRGRLSPAEPESPRLVAWGGYVEGLYSLFGALEAVVRYDAFEPAVGPGRDFLLLGLNIFPGFHSKFGLQYAFGLGGSPPGPDLADGQFILLTQLSF